MFRRILSMLLILSVLGYGSVLSTDLHGAFFGDLVQVDGSDPHGAGGADFDHCSHGVVHLLGIERLLTIHLRSGRSQLAIYYHRPVPAFPVRRLLRPPIYG